MQKLPSDDEILALHKKYAPTREAFELVYTHCQIIWEIAQQLMVRNTLKLDREIVRAGSLLHDIGVYTLYKDGEIQGGYIRHGVLGEALLEDENMSEIIGHIASHHTGVGLSRQEIIREGLPLPHEDFFAKTPEERLIMYADKFHSKTTPPQFNSTQWYANDIKKVRHRETKTISVDGRRIRRAGS
ncbi:MAG TPA: HD domain-containing protein [Candidatus Saccharimonadales bacterium]|nr:HD domain-containing protein [Candidatus Saccharimonadales bacterium]